MFFDSVNVVLLQLNHFFMAVTDPYLPPLKPNKSKQKPPAITSNDDGLLLRTHVYPPARTLIVLDH